MTSKRFGVGLYSPVALSDPGVPPEGVIVFERGYYERARKGPPPLTLP